MRMNIVLFTIALLFVSCNEAATVPTIPEPVDNPKPKPPQEVDENKVILPFYTYDAGDIPATAAKVGDQIVLDVSDYDYDTSMKYNWVAWTGPAGGWNSGAFGTSELSQPVLVFNAPFPGGYRISWCPSDAKYACVLHGELEVAGEVPINQVPEVEFFYGDEVELKTICSTGCSTLLENNQPIVLAAQIDDDDDEHHFSWTGRLSGQEGLEVSGYHFAESGLRFIPTKEGRYDFLIYTYDRHITVNGPQRVQSNWSFIVRDTDNQLPTSSFYMVGYPSITASMVFQFDDESSLYYPVINYFHEKTFSQEDCGITHRLCYPEDLHIELYQNNFSGTELPSFNKGDTLVFDGSASSDPENQALSYLWSGIVDQPTSNANVQLPDGDGTAIYTFVAEEIGDYLVSMCVQESGYKTLYQWRSPLMWPLYWRYAQRCPEIQFRVVK